MEEYIIDNYKNEENNIRFGKYYEHVYKKHVEAYSERGADNIRENITNTFKEARRQELSPIRNNNMLLVGKVQSGKTSNLELFTSLAFDNGYNLVMIYGGYDNTLLSQTITRFKKTFNISSDMDYCDNTPVVFSSDDSNQLLSLDDEIVEDLLEANKPIFLISMKRPAAMNKINQLLSRIDTSNIHAFIIDDEGDQASLNTKKNKKNDASATYEAIVKMKQLLNDPLYLSVTATPQALIFLDEYSKLRPDTVRIIEPGYGYCGADSYHLYDSDKIEIISDDAQQMLSEGNMPNSLRNAINHYLIASAIMYKRGIQTSDMIIHSHRNVADHDMIYKLVNANIEMLKDSVKYKDKKTMNTLKDEIKKTYDSFFGDETRSEYQFDDIWKTICSKIIKRIYIILKNSAGQITQANESLRKYKIYIGGDLLQRGVTFSHLVTTYFSRWARDGGNMDTNLQRARWFGYRNKYIDLCKIFTSMTIAREFTNLAEIEADLWEQFNAIQCGEIKIEDILIRAEDTIQRPTRRNVANYNMVSFKSKWIKQRIGLFDLNQIENNNAVIQKLISEHDFAKTTVGRNDGRTSAMYSIMDKKLLLELIEHMQLIFDLEPFENKPLIDLIQTSDEIPVILMNNFDSGRERSFYNDNRIYALQQGADNKDVSKVKYRGDSQVVVDKSRINIQIHKIIPKKKQTNGTVVVMNDYVQYMFAIYVPKEKKYFVRGE